jgi:hypothetical protein
MSAIGGPNVVEDGLVLALDAANDKSFRGEPTENLLINPIFIDNSENNIPDGYAISGLSSGNNSFSLNDGILTITNNSGERNFITPFSSNLPNLEDGKQYTFSVTIHRADANFRFAWISNNSGIMVNDLVDLSKPFPQRGSVAINSSGSNTIRLGIGVSTSDVEGVVSFSKVQLEEKPYATPFVDGTRGTTVATGGGWADRSGNNNHGELINGPTFNSDNLGSIQFDGVDDYVDTNQQFNFSSNSSFSISCWVFQNSAQWVSGNGPGYIGKTRVSLHSWSLGVLDGGDLNFEVRGNGDRYQARTQTPLQEWFFVVCTYNNGEGLLYVNNELKASFNYPLSDGDFDTNRIVEIGRRASDSNRVMDGNISIAQIYNKALTPEEVLQNFNATKSRYGL